ncbi:MULTISPECIES: sensor histidine kinase [Flavobacterium]|uniref:histidine kinase n=1 Tax=Flavobacterium jumunjinense TaxID=998845 RepID=A0ABV5GL21_9FLAO|nr:MULTISPECIES: ATP-binding protein [Flavobacterium]
MNSLLKRQIEKHLKNGLNDIDQFFTAVDNSYANFEEQIAMLQRAMKISSDELYEANQKLREEADSLKEINSNLEFVLESMSLDTQTTGKLEEFSSANYIKQQTQEIVKINKQREELVINLEKQNKELSQYAHMVSHDLKAPLRSIDALINWFIEDNPEFINEKNKESLDLILFNVEKMDLLIGGILDYSSVDTKKTDDRLIDINALVQELVQTLDVPKNITIKIDNVLPKIFGNDFRFNQLFQNLIQNAIKYNRKEVGLIEIGCKEDENVIEFYIKDNGMGIPEPYHNKIFEIFSKLESNNQSSGIGLSIVKKIIEIYNGQIWLESQEDIGTTFYFTLPKNNGKA